GPASSCRSSPRVSRPWTSSLSRSRRSSRCWRSRTWKRPARKTASAWKSSPDRAMAEASVTERLVDQIEQRYRELEEQLADPETIADRARYADVAREHRELGEPHALAERYRRAQNDAALLDDGETELDADERREFQEIVSAARAEMDQLEEELRLAMVERDPNDAKNVIVEIRAGAGGDEAALFAGDLYRMLTKYAERRGF